MLISLRVELRLKFFVSHWLPSLHKRFQITLVKSCVYGEVIARVLSLSVFALSLGLSFALLPPESLPITACKCNPHPFLLHTCGGWSGARWCSLPFSNSSHVRQARGPGLWHMTLTSFPAYPANRVLSLMCIFSPSPGVNIFPLTSHPRYSRFLPCSRQKFLWFFHMHMKAFHRGHRGDGLLESWGSDCCSHLPGNHTGKPFPGSS